MDIFLSRGRNETVPDQWQTQIFLRVLQKASVIFISQMDPDLVCAMHMIPAESLEAAMRKAKEILKNDNPTITAIPDGVAVMVKGV